MAKKSLARARRSQEAQIKRITGIVNKMQQQGFRFNKQFLSSLKVTGKTAGDAAKKAEKLKGLTKSKILEKVKSYTTDTGQMITGKGAGKRGALMEQRKRKQARISGLQNVEDALNSTVDAIHPQGKWIDLTSEKRELLQAWNRYKDNVTAKNYDQGILDAVTEYAYEIINPSDDFDHYDAVTGKIYHIMTGEPMPVNAIATSGEEEI